MNSGEERAKAVRAIGWIMRGFLGIPSGRDVKSDPEDDPVSAR